MELPKHTTQVGTIAANKKLYLEDYCISYMKQLGELYPEERKQIALFGIVEKEKSVEYAFAYGAALLGKGKGRTDSLTANQREEAEAFRVEYFSDYQLLGVVISTDTVDENVYWLGNGTKSIPMDGYYIFYDQNEAMLNFMMHNQTQEREVDLDPVIVKKADMDREKREKREKAEQEKQEIQKKTSNYRQKLQKSEKEIQKEKVRKRKSPFPMAACLLLLAITGIYGMKVYQPQAAGGLQQLKMYVADLWDKTSMFTSSYLGEKQPVSGSDGGNINDESSGMEGLEEVTSENNTKQEQDIVVVSTEVQKPAELNVAVIPEPETLTENISSNGNQVVENITNNVQQQEEQVKPEIQPTQPTQQQSQTQQPSVSQPTQSQGVEMESDVSQEYLIKKGDNLLRILRAYYGDESRLSEICDVNGIVDPNNIQVGQTILLP